MRLAEELWEKASERGDTAAVTSFAAMADEISLYFESASSRPVDGL